MVVLQMVMRSEAPYSKNRIRFLYHHPRCAPTWSCQGKAFNESRRGHVKRLKTNMSSVRLVSGSTYSYRQLVCLSMFVPRSPAVRGGGPKLQGAPSAQYPGLRAPE